MARPLRRDYVGAVHHVFVRGNARSAIAVDAVDHERLLDLLGRTSARFELVCHAWCFLPNHFHLLLTSQLGNLSRAMHWFGTCTAHSFNHRHERSGHLYQGRFGSKVVEDDAYLLELARYLPLNPVRAGLCSSPEDWPWSSHAATTGLREAHRFLDTELLISALGSVDAYVAWVRAGVDPAILDERGFRRPRPTPSLAAVLTDRSDAAIARARSHGYSQAAIGRHLGVSQKQVSRRLAASSAASQLAVAGRRMTFARRPLVASSSSSSSTSPRGPGSRSLVSFLPSPPTGSG
jgi:REP element-mobilizing transposase RayT